MKRLFVFGCSFTQWNWPTWADILAKNYDHFENWGKSGIGNRAISQRISECVLKNTFTDQDTIIVQWTDYHRFDQHISGLFPESSWRLGGSLLVKEDKEIQYIKDTWREDSYIYDSLTVINLAESLLKNTKARVLFLSRTDMSVDLEQFPQLEFLSPVLESDLWVGDPIQEYVDSLDYKGKPMMVKDAMMFGVPIGRPVLDLHPLPSHYHSWLTQTFPDQILDHEFAKHADTVLESISHYDQFNNDYETRMNWPIKGPKYIRGY
jgi:hypothetical protein